MNDLGIRLSGIDLKIKNKEYSIRNSYLLRWSQRQGCLTLLLYWLRVFWPKLTFQIGHNLKGEYPPISGAIVHANASCRRTEKYNTSLLHYNKHSIFPYFCKRIKEKE